MGNLVKMGDIAYVLDTNIIIRYLRKEPTILNNFNHAAMQDTDLVIPQMVDYEIRRGFRIVSAPKKEAAYCLLYEQCQLPQMDVHSWRRAEQVYEELYRKGFTVGEMDILIAAFCLENDCVLVTANTNDFKNIDGLQMVNWAE